MVHFYSDNFLIYFDLAITSSPCITRIRSIAIHSQRQLLAFAETTMKRSGSQASGLLPPPNKRARSTPRESHGGTKRCARNFNEADLCDAVFPVVWSFLLEPSRNDPSSRTISIDFKSISSRVQRRRLILQTDGRYVLKRSN
jgi:hypothetical protein